MPLRRVLPALLLAILLIAPMVDCALHGDDAHTRLGGGRLAVVAVASEAHYLHGPGAHSSGHCDQHIVHCLEKAVLPPSGTAAASLPWSALIAAVVLFALTLACNGSRGTRGPPGGLPVSSGRSILTKFCIARR